MKINRYIVLSAIFVLFSITQTSSLSAQPDYRKSIYDSYISGNMEKWSAVISDLESGNQSGDAEQLRLLNYYYGYTGYLTGKNRKKEAETYIRRAEEIIDNKLKSNPNNATMLAYKGSFLGYKILIDKKKKLLIGPKSMKYIKKAYETDSENLQAITDMANFLYYAPGAFGGNKKRAIELYEKAVQKIERGNLTADNWFYIHIMVFLAKHHTEMGNNQKAAAVYEKIRATAPAITWIDNKSLLNAYFNVDY